MRARRGRVVGDRRSVRRDVGRERLDRPGGRPQGARRRHAGRGSGHGGCPGPGGRRCGGRGACLEPTAFGPGVRRRGRARCTVRGHITVALGSRDRCQSHGRVPRCAFGDQSDDGRWLDRLHLLGGQRATGAGARRLLCLEGRARSVEPFDRARARISRDSQQRGRSGRRRDAAHARRPGRPGHEGRVHGADAAGRDRNARSDRCDSEVSVVRRGESHHRRTHCRRRRPEPPRTPLDAVVWKGIP